MGDAKQISKKLNVFIYMHSEGNKYVTNSVWNLSRSCRRNITLEDVKYLKDNDIITLEVNPDIILRVIYVLGHTLDSVVYYSVDKNIAFVGDTIFAGSIGRSDFYGGNAIQLFIGIVQKIFSLPDNTILYSEHSKPTTVANEKNIQKQIFRF